MDAARVEVVHAETVRVAEDRDRVGDVGVVVAGPVDEEPLALEPLDLARPMDGRAREARVGRFGRPVADEPPKL